MLDHQKTAQLYFIVTKKNLDNSERFGTFGWFSRIKCFGRADPPSVAVFLKFRTVENYFKIVVFCVMVLWTGWLKNTFILLWAV